MKTISLNIFVPGVDLSEFVNADLRLLLETVGILEPMFRATEKDEEGFLPVMATADAALANVKSAEIDLTINGVGIELADFANVEELGAHLVDTMQMVPEALMTNPTLSGQQFEAPKSGAQFGFMDNRDGPAKSPFDRSMVSNDATGIVKVVTTTTANDDGGTTITETVYRESGIVAETVETSDSDGNITSIETTDTYPNNRYQTNRWEANEEGGYDTSNEHGSVNEDGERIPDPATGPGGQPSETAPPKVGGVLDDPSWWSDPKNPDAKLGESVTEAFESSSTMVSTDLSWQEQLKLEEDMVTNPGLAGLVSVDSFAFSTPHTDPEGNPIEPDVPGPAKTVQVAAPNLTNDHALAMGGEFPTDTIDDFDDLVGPIFDAFIF